MGSLGAGEVAKKKAIWLYPMFNGVGPSERWGHSACYSNGLVHIFGGCCGGMHFSDVLVLNLETMDWSILMTKGQGPGPRDSHSAVIVGYKMIVFGGTNGLKKVNDIHILDLRSKEWTCPECKGIPPSPRESHTATLVGEEKLLIFGGSGEGEANYLNDLHVLDIKTMRWASPEVSGSVPVPRDSHSAVAIGNRLILYGGDSGDRYQGAVDVLDMDTLTWSKMDVQGPSPGVRAGHTSVNFGTKVYVIGGVAHKQYYNDVWVLDVVSCSWRQLDVCGQKPQGRFSHAAAVTNLDTVTIFGGCGEDERPLNELLILQLGVGHANGLYKMPFYRTSGSQSNQERKRVLRDTENSLQKRTVLMGTSESLVIEDAEESLPKKSLCIDTDTFHMKRRRTNNFKMYGTESDAEEHSLSVSQNSSPSQSDQEQTPIKKFSEIRAPQVFPIFKQHSATPVSLQSNHVLPNQPNPKTIIPRIRQDLHVFGEHPNQLRPDNLQAINIRKHEVHFPADGQRSLEAGQFENLIGAEVHGNVDGAFDSGYLMTATVNGKTFRGVLFAPGPYVMSRGISLGQRPSSLTNHVAHSQVNACASLSSLGGLRQSQQPTKQHAPEFQLAQVRTSTSAIGSPPSSNTQPTLKSELQGVVLSLGGPGNGNGRL
ncbi:hypothetical protein ACH5RR_022837 [Cinchona calisaya]|uniref:Uncharacterized protein n=1 Tax=Cinchona calisaya TaxID=153742 RepID=A0ABD2ZC82_9GENT